MPRVPHDIFRHILSFKDPRYEKVMAPGDGFGKTPTRVWHTRREYIGRADGVCRTPAIVRYDDGCSLLPVVKIVVYKRYEEWWHDHEQYPFRVNRGINMLERSINPDLYDYDGRADECCFRTHAEMSLQCEACGPDLFVHDYARQMHATNK